MTVLSLAMHDLRQLLGRRMSLAIVLGATIMTTAGFQLAPPEVKQELLALGRAEGGLELMFFVVGLIIALGVGGWLRRVLYLEERACGGLVNLLAGPVTAAQLVAGKTLAVVLGSGCAGALAAIGFVGGMLMSVGAPMGDFRSLGIMFCSMVLVGIFQYAMTYLESVEDLRTGRGGMGQLVRYGMLMLLSLGAPRLSAIPEFAQYAGAVYAATSVFMLLLAVGVAYAAHRRLRRLTPEDLQLQLR